MAEILVVDDERVLRKGMKVLLEGEGYAVRTAEDGEAALREIAAKRPDLVLLDVMMPRMNGYKCCEAIRRLYPLLPVIFLTAKDTDADQVRGLGLGADDFISKDAPDAVLLARIARALARGEVFFEPKAAPAGGAELRLGSVTVVLGGYAVLDGGREIARLTKTEGDLLRFLSVHRGELFTIDRLIAVLRGDGFACEDAMLYVHISNLRQKLGPAADFIVHQRGAGYGLRA